jgi:hypothetical protein
MNEKNACIQYKEGEDFGYLQVVKCCGGMYINSSTTHTYSLAIIGSSNSSTHKYRESL